MNGVVTQLVKVGDLRASLGGGVRHWIDAPAAGPEGTGLRLLTTFLF